MVPEMGKNVKPIDLFEEMGGNNELYHFLYRDEPHAESKDGFRGDGLHYGYRQIARIMFKHLAED